MKFATSHNIGVSVFSTGHEFNDRGSGPCPNTLLIRTTCLIDAEFDLTEDNRFGHSDGIARLGSGLTWGTSILGFEGELYSNLYHIFFHRILTLINH